MEQEQRLSQLDSSMLATLRLVVWQFREFDGEFELFDMEAEAAWKRMAAGKPLLVGGVTPADYEFGGAFAETLAFLMLLWGSYKALGELRGRVRQYANDRRAAEQVVRDSWKTHLVHAGLKPEVAEAIVDAHGTKVSEHVFQFLMTETPRAAG